MDPRKGFFKLFLLSASVEPTAIARERNAPGFLLVCPATLCVRNPGGSPQTISPRGAWFGQRLEPGGHRRGVRGGNHPGGDRPRIERRGGCWNSRPVARARTARAIHPAGQVPDQAG